jgi:hypothetical protein
MIARMVYFYNFDKKLSTLSEIILFENNATDDMDIEQETVAANTMGVEHKLIITIFWSMLVISGAFGIIC